MAPTVRAVTKPPKAGHQSAIHPEFSVSQIV